MSSMINLECLVWHAFLIHIVSPDLILGESYEGIFFALTYFGPEFAPLGKSMKLLIGNGRRTWTCFVSKTSLEFLAFFN